jgi:hypothetical protein
LTVDADVALVLLPARRERRDHIVARHSQRVRRGDGPEQDLAVGVEEQPAFAGGGDVLGEVPGVPHVGWVVDTVAARTEVPGADILDPRREDHQPGHVRVALLEASAKPNLSG